MEYKTFVSMNIAIIGVSRIAESYALALVDAGHEVFMAWKEGEKRKINPALSSIDRINFCSIEAAADIADIIIIATSPIDVREVSYWLGDVRHKVIIDATSNVFVGIEEQVRTVCAIRAITGSQHIVKAFHTKGYEQLLQPLFREHIDLILVGGCKKAKAVTMILARELGINRFYDFGGDEAIPLFNAMTSSWRDLLLKSRAEKRPVAIPQHAATNK